MKSTLIVFLISNQCRHVGDEARRMQLGNEEIKSSLSQKLEKRNKSIVELENVVNELRMNKIKQDNKVRTFVTILLGCCSRKKAS